MTRTPLRPKTPPASRRRLLLLSVLLLGVLGWGGARLVRGAWAETIRREAYLPDLEAASERQPNDERTLAVLGGRLAEGGRYKEAAQVLERAVAAGCLEESVWRTWAASHAAAGDIEKARDVLLDGAEPGRSYDPAALKAARDRCKALGENPTPQAVAHAICPDGPADLLREFASGSFLNGWADRQARQHPEKSGFAFREREAKARPDDANTLVRWCDALRRNRRLREAEEVGKKAVALAPDSPETHRAYGDVLLDGGVWGKAGLQYKAALEARPDWTPALVGLGRVAAEKKLIQFGFEVLEKAVKQDPENPEVWIALGRNYNNQGLRPDKALEAFQTAARLAPERTDFFAYYSDVLRVNFKLAEAEALLRRRLADAPDDARSHYLLATLLLDDRRTPQREAEAETLLRRSLELQPDAPVVRVSLAQLLLDQKKPEDAGPLLIDALEAMPHDATATRLLARSYQAIGQPEKAAALQKRAVALSRYAERLATLEYEEQRKPLDLSVHRALAKVYAEGGEPEKAKRQEEIVYMLTHHRDKAEKGLSRLMEAMSRYSTVEDDSADRAAADGTLGGVKPGKM